MPKCRIRLETGNCPVGAGNCPGLVRLCRRDLSEFPEDRASGARRQYLVTDDNDAIIWQSNNWIDITTTLVARRACGLSIKPVAQMSRDELGAYYRATVGYDPLEDCPTIDPEEIRQALREFETGEIR
jgi:hypothetical protein